MADIRVISDNIISPLGWTTDENIDAIVQGQSALAYFSPSKLIPFNHFSSIINELDIQRHSEPLVHGGDYTKLEKLCICSISNALSMVEIDTSDRRSGLILSTTKGNIDSLLGKKNSLGDRRFLPPMAQRIASYFNFITTPIVVSNACISGVMAILIAQRMIEGGFFNQMVICGADLVTPFTLTGFNSLKALSQDRCKPFDRNRVGINLGESASTLVLSSNAKIKHSIRVLGGAISNDANHVSSPSINGEGMQQVIEKTLNSESVQVDFISAHGTATKFNDNMESIAIHNRGLGDIPVNSFKGYWGHTLGAAGIIESIAACHSLLKNILIQSMGCEINGTTKKINVIKETEKKKIKTCLKLASGFGGCNAAILFEKE